MVSFQEIPVAADESVEVDGAEIVAGAGQISKH